MADAGFRDDWFSLINGKVEVQAAMLNSAAHIIANEYSLLLHPLLSTGSSSSSAISHTESSTTTHCDEHKKMLIAELANKRKLTVPTFISKFLFQPIVPLRVGALRLIRALAIPTSGWGLLMLFQDPALKEFVLTPGTEMDRDCRAAKFDAISAIHHNPQLQLFGTDLVAKFGRLVAHGPHYKPSQQDEPMIVDR
jgi:hypothetical protein